MTLLLIISSLFWAAWFLWPWADYLVGFRISKWIDEQMWIWMDDFARETGNYSMLAPFDINELRKRFNR